MKTIQNRNCKVEFSLHDLRVSKNLKQSQLTKALKISPSLYCAIECGERKPNIDVVYALAVIYKTSMDFIYHAFYRQHYVWHFPEGDLQYALREAKAMDIQYIRERVAPEAPPTLPNSIIWETN